jgi:hypothetical protein
MFGSSMLDIAVGIVFVFLLLSILATGINEIIMSAMNMRAKELLRGIESLLNDKDNSNGLVQQVYTHGQVYGLYRGTFDAKKQSDLPSYIPSRNFALALIDIIAQKGEEPRTTSAQQTANHPPQAQPQQFRQVAPLPPTTQTTGVAIVPIPPSIRNGAAAYAANSLTDKLGKPLVAMIAMAGNDVNKLQKAIEDWYNSAMDRVSGWYKYRTQKWLLGIGLVMAITINADTLRIVRQLSKDSTLRQSIVAAAQNSKPAQTAADQTVTTGVTSAIQSFDGVSSLGIPFGWPQGAPHLYAVYQHPLTWGNWAELLGRGSSWEILLGWILTAIAVSLGAPFWFDALNRIMVIRSTVKPTEKSQDEPSKS